MPKDKIIIVGHVNEGLTALTQARLALHGIEAEVISPGVLKQQEVKSPFDPEPIPITLLPAHKAPTPVSKSGKQLRRERRKSERKSKPKK